MIMVSSKIIVGSCHSKSHNVWNFLLMLLVASVIDWEASFQRKKKQGVLTLCLMPSGVRWRMVGWRWWRKNDKIDNRRIVAKLWSIFVVGLQIMILKFSILFTYCFSFVESFCSFVALFSAWNWPYSSAGTLLTKNIWKIKGWLDPFINPNCR